MATSKDPEIPKLELELFNDVSSSMQANIEKARQASLPPNWRELDLNDPRLSAPAFQVPDFTTLEGMKVRGLLDENGNATKLGEDYILLEDHGMLMDGNPTEKAEAFTTPLDDIVSGAKFDLLRSQVDYTAPESQKAKRLFQIRRDSGIDEPDVETSFVDDVFNVLKGVNQMRIAVGTALGGKGLGMMDDSDVSSEEQAAAAMSIAQGFKNTPLETLGGVGAFVQRNITGPIAELTGTPKDEVENKRLEIELTNAARKLVNRQASAANVIDAVTETTAAAQTYQAARENFKARGGTEEEFEQIQSAAEGAGGMVSDPLNLALAPVVVATKAIPNVIKAAETARSIEKSAVASSTLGRIAAKSGELTQRGKLLEGEIIAAQKQAQDLLTVGKANEARALLGQAQAKSAEVQDISSRLAKLDEGFKVNQGVLQTHQARIDKIMTSPSFGRVAGSNVVKSVSHVTDKLGDATGWAARGIKKIEHKLGFSKIPWLIKAAAGVPYAKIAGTYYSGRAGLIYGAPLLKKMAQFGATVSEEMLQVKQTLPFWRRVASKQNSRVGQMMAGLGEFTTPIARGVASPIKGAAYTLPYTALYESINSNGLDEAALRRAGANALVFGPLTRLAGGKNDWQKASVGDLVNFRNKLSVEPEKLQVFEAIPSRQVKQFVASFDAAYPNMFDYNFINSGNSFFDSQTRTVTFNVNDRAGMVKALAGHEINHALQFVHQSDSAVIAKMLGSEGKAGLVRDTDGNFDPEFKAWGNEYNARMKAQGLPERPIEDLAIEYYTDVGAQTLFEDVVSGKMYKAAQKSNVRRRIEEMFNKTMAAPPIIKEVHYKLGGATDGHGRMVMGSGLLADGIRELPEVKAMVRNMYRESAGLPGKYAVSPNESFGKSTNPNHHKAAEAIKKLNEESVKNKTPLVDGALHPDAKGNGTGRIPSEYFAQLEEMGIIPDGSWGRAIDINENIDQAVAYLLDYRPIRQGRSIQVEGRTINNIKPVGWVLHEGRLYLAAMDLNQLNANVTKAAGSEIAKGLKLSKEDIMNDINAVAELHAKNKSTDGYFKKVADEKGYPERWRSRKNFINATQGLMTEGQLVGNPMFHALGQTKKSGIYRTFAFDLLDDAVRMNGESVTGYGPNSYYNLKQNLMPQMPNVNRNGDIIPDAAGKRKFMPNDIGKDKFYSQLERVITTKVPSRATPQQIMATIDPTRGSGVKADEIKWSGIEQALPKLAVDGKVSKDALLEYLRNEGRVRFEEVTLGSAPSVYQENGRWYVKGQENLGYSNSKEEAQALASRPDVVESTSPTKYAQYQLPGGENYREVVLAMPLTDKGKITKLPEGYSLRPRLGNKWGVFSPDNRLLVEGLSEQDARDKGIAYLEKDRLRFPGTGEKSEYTSSHFPDIPNYVAHMRVNERVDANGRPGLFVEEFQSDRHQEGRKKGYRGEGTTLPQGWTVEEIPTYQYRGGPQIGTEWMVFDSSKTQVGFGAKTREEAIKSANLGDVPGSVADAPFRTTWPLQLFKRALRDAVDGGKDWIGWTDGATQNARFDLSKQVHRVLWEPRKGGRGNLRVLGKESDTLLDQEMPAEKVEDYIGKEAAARLFARPVEKSKFFPDTQTLDGDGLKVGGSGMKGFYDNMLPKEIGKYVKPFGGKVEKSSIIDPDGGRDISFNSKDQAEKWASDPANTGDHETSVREDIDGKWIVWDDFSKRYYTEGEAVTIWRINITPEMRKITETGQARFMPKDSQKSPNKVRRSTFEGSSKQPKSNKSLANSISYLISGALSRQMEREHEKTNGRRPQ